jgi:hypothetical protein
MEEQKITDDEYAEVPPTEEALVEEISKEEISPLQSWSPKTQTGKDVKIHFFLNTKSAVV